jgi:ParB family chromosome partitioning protein
MSTKADKMLGRFGGNIASVVGARPEAPAPIAPAAPDRFEGAVKSRAFGELPVDAVGRDESQPRSEFDPADIDQLAPIRVRHDGARWIVLVGERRLRACKRAGLERVRVEFVDRPMTEADVLAEQVVENVARAELKPVEQGRAYRRLMEMNGWTAEQLADTLGVEPTSVHRALGMLRLPDDVANQVDAGRIKATAAYEISKLQIADDQREVAALVASGGLDHKATVAEVARRKASGRAKGKRRGAARLRKETERTFRVAGGKILVENRKGVDATWIRAALVEALAKLDREAEGRAEAAA